ncbi:MAG: hypothetical protein DMG35_06245 [Acidobacteria bacterium]|nr:MAG: hypothetical protein DMG35_06245 [Acidobacteriota bacterium]
MLEREHKNTSQEFNRDSSLPCGWVSMHSGGYRVTMKSGKLWLQELTGADGIVHRTLPFDELRPVQMDEFALSGAPIVFRFMRKRTVTGFVLNGFHERGILFIRIGKQQG